MGTPKAKFITKNLEQKTIQQTEYSISSKCHIIATEQVYLTDKAKSQLKFSSNLPDMLTVCGMPDLHPGLDAPIGAAFLCQNRIYPALVGSDIGCGISLRETSLSAHRANINKLSRKLGNLDELPDSSWLEYIQERQAERQLSPTPFDHRLGIIGSGNHFAEITALDKIYGDYANELNLKAGKLHLLIHSGSGGLGAEIFRTHAFQAGHRGIAFPGDEAMRYLSDHEQAVKFAHLNREMIAQRMLHRLDADGTEILSVHHNFVEKLTDNQFLHRKGAAPADQGLVVIAGNRGDFSFLVKPKPAQKSLCSIAHGAGRKWRRSDCKPRLEKRYTHWRELERTPFGGKVICNNRHLAYEEAPEAYKSIDSIIESLLAAHLIEVVARLRPLITYKTMRR